MRWTGALEIAAIGARTPIGLTAESAAAAARAGISRIGAHPFIVDGRGDPVRMAVDARLDPKLAGWQRVAPLLDSALGQVIEKVGETAAAKAEWLVVFPETRPGFSEDDAQRVLERLARGRAIRPTSVSIAGRGHAGAILAMEVASERLLRGAADLCIIAAADSYVDADTLEWLEANGELRTEQSSTGFFPGEAGAAMAIGRAGARAAVGVPPLATIRGVRTAVESRLARTGADVFGEGLHAAIAGATADLAQRGHLVDAIYCDMNGARYRTDEWAFAVLRSGRVLSTTAYVAPCDGWGDVGAASAALGCILAIRAWERRCANGPRALVWASSAGGLRGAAVLEQPGGA